MDRELMVDEEEEMYCNRCLERQMFKKTSRGTWVCEVCGHEVADVYEAESDEDNDTEEEPPFF
jgi:ribosomal protein L37AE/L43A